MQRTTPLRVFPRKSARPLLFRHESFVQLVNGQSFVNYRLQVRYLLFPCHQVRFSVRFAFPNNRLGLLSSHPVLSPGKIVDDSILLVAYTLYFSHTVFSSVGVPTASKLPHPSKNSRRASFLIRNFWPRRTL